LGNSFSNLLPNAERVDDVVMPHFPQTQTKTRSPRVRVPNNESIRFNLGGHQVSAVLQKISLTGGLAEFSRSIGSATIAEAKVNTLSGPVSGLVEFLPAQLGSCTYPFRFIALSDQDYQRLNATLQYMRKQGYGD
jgi:hypothetical protein